MNWITRLFSFLARYFSTGRAVKDAELALSYVGRALPYVQAAAEIITTLTPTGIDDALWTAIKAKYPRLLDGTPKTSDELKAEGLVIATELLKWHYPALSTTIARTATQLAYIDFKAEGK